MGDGGWRINSRGDKRGQILATDNSASIFAVTSFIHGEVK
jgi:hypothetical protein